MEVEENLRRTVAAEIARFEAADPKPTADIGLVWAFSGPGTAFEPWSAGDPEWMAWMDLTRLMHAVRLVCQVTSIRSGIPVTEVGKNNVQEFGPYLLYNGVDSKFENEDAVSWLSHERSRIPASSSALAIREVTEGTENREIKNTRDQVLSMQNHWLWKQVGGTNSTVALVSHSAHLPRILRYIDFYKPIPKKLSIRCFPVRNHETLAQDTLAETEAVARYYQMGHLSTNPYPADLGLS